MLLRGDLGIVTWRKDIDLCDLNIPRSDFVTLDIVSSNGSGSNYAVR